ncbi:hypothetical protein HOC13_00350 [Candidatus Woesearchaeota archaeon]|nr:hypothetical protein [Candidatus Woesearchaeota archaeon]
MRCKLLVFVLALLLLVSSALAATVSTIEPINNNINTNQQASFELTVTNTGEVTQSYKVYSLELGWIIDPLPKDRTFDLNPGSSKTTTIKVDPLESFKPGAYAPTLYIDEIIGGSYSTQTKSLKLYISPEGPLDYLPSIKSTIDMNEKINPQDPLSIKLFLENKNPLNLKDLKIKLQSDMIEFNKEVVINIPPLEKKTIEFSITPNFYQQPKDYYLFFIFERNGETVKVIDKKIEIITTTPDFTTEVVEEKSFLKTSLLVNTHNTGNVKNTQEVKVPTSFFVALLTSSEAKSMKEDGQRYLVWTTTLGPDEYVVLKGVRNYRIPLGVIIVILILLGVYAYIRSPVSLSKQATSKKKGSSLSELKITLLVKNLSKKPLKNVEVIDQIPGITNLEKGLSLGTLRPQEVKHTSRGTLVKWKLAELEPHEHRVITYEIKSSLNILGSLQLPRGKVLYGKGKKKKTAYSNSFKISSQT